MMRYILSVLTALVMLQSCKEGPQVPDTSGIEVEVKVRRMEQEVMALKSKEEIAQFLSENPRVDSLYFLQAFQHRPITREQEIEMIWRFINNEHTEKLLEESYKDLEDMTPIVKELEEGFKLMKYYFPDFKEPELYTMISGFGMSGFGGDFVDGRDFVVLGIDYFSDSVSYQPPHLPLYMYKRYQPSYISAALLTLLSREYINYNLKDRTLVNEMLAYGKAHEIRRRTLPHVADTTLWGWSAEELEGAYANEQLIWSYFIENELLFDTKAITSKKFCGEAPTVPEISPECPGRIGRWLGWRIIQQYMEKYPEKSLQEVLEIDDAKELLYQSGYRPPQE
ncbi:hypothetical protein [Algivirga pacifica]|uniref:Gliding motility lipoprotein GldB n=1 Tax=Algivirga pacifica TaxID=1162670 RepID=A0ABP9DHF3_9BACT